MRVYNGGTSSPVTGVFFSTGLVAASITPMICAMSTMPYEKRQPEDENVSISVCRYRAPPHPPPGCEWTLCLDPAIERSARTLIQCYTRRCCAPSRDCSLNTAFIYVNDVCVCESREALANTQVHAHIPPFRYRCQAARVGSGRLGFALVRSDARVFIFWPFLQMSGNDPESLLCGAAPAAAV